MNCNIELRDEMKALGEIYCTLCCEQIDINLVSNYNELCCSN